jgi:molybdate transport system substrate-binding protein
MAAMRGCRGLGLILAAVVLAGSSGGVMAQTLTLYAAGSLREAMTEIARDYGAARHVEVKTEFGPSGILRERIERGEKGDVFASADLGHPIKLTQDGRAEGTLLFARNAVCAASHRDLGLSTATLLDRLLGPAVTTIGTSSPKNDPLGDYTLTMFHRAEAVRSGAEKALLAKSKEIFGGAGNNAPVGGVDPVVARLTDGTASVVFIYCSGRERLTAQMADLALTPLPEALEVGPEYGLTVLKGAGEGARDLALFILSLDGQAILAKRGFTPVALPRDLPAQR